MVVDAYLTASERADLPPLLVAGRLGPEVARAVAERIAAAENGTAVRVVGWISDADLAEHYRNALLVIQLAADEGFGLQPLEALASGAPLVVADTPVVRDVAGKAAVYVNGGGDDLVGEIIRLVSAPDVRANLRFRGPAVAASYTWSAMADSVRAALAAAANGRLVPVTHTAGATEL